VGLALAFVAALFSTVSRQSGNVVATALLASVALLLAGIVGLTTVPYLARRVAVEHVRDSFNYDVTRIGFGHLALALILALAALNTGNNLLWVVVSAMLGALLVSGVASAMNLGKLRLEVRLPEHAFAGRPLLARVALHNDRRLLPAFSISVAPVGEKKLYKSWRVERVVFAFPSHRPAKKQWFRLPDFLLRRVADSPPAGIFQKEVYFPYIPAAGVLAANVELRFSRRGLYSQRSFAIATRFPFSLLKKTRQTRLDRDLIVFPGIEPTDDLLEVLPLITGEFESYVRGRGYDLYRIREYTQEDSARHLDWKATAKSGIPLVREFTREDERKLRIVFDNPAPGLVPEESYERAVAMAASVAWHFSSQQSELLFAAPDLAASADIQRFLTWLALAQPAQGPSVLDSLTAGAEYNIVFTARARGTIPTGLWTRSYFLFITEPAGYARGKPPTVAQKC
jgi:uncharacterized protein (DUF58 family)